MVNVKLAINTANAAFFDPTIDDENDPAHAAARETEIDRILKKCVDRIQRTGIASDGFNVLAINGNVVGVCVKADSPKADPDRYDHIQAFSAEIWD